MVAIRQAVLADAEPLQRFAAALYAERLAEMFLHDTAPSVAEETEFIRGFQRDNGLLLVAVPEENDDGDANGVVGMLGFSGHRRPQLRHAGMMALSVAAAHRRRGIGDRLMQALVAWVEADPHIRRVELDVFAINRPAIQLFTKHGFAVEGTMRRAVEVDGTLIDNLLMARVWE